MILIFAVAVANTVVTRTIPAARFIRTMRPASADFSQWYITTASWRPPNPAPRFTPALAAHVPFPDGSDRLLLVLYAPDAPPGEVAMQLVVAAKGSLQAGYFLPDYGAPHLAVDLSARQAERVVREGIPDSLLRAIADHADRVSWKPSNAFAMLTVGGEIDPEPHFPPE